MDEKYIKAFNSVVTFVNDLWLVFGNDKRVCPLALYRRLIEHIKFVDSEAINKILCNFKEFLSTYEVNIMSNTLEYIPRGTFITYGNSQKVYIDIQKFIYKTKDDPETRETIRQHLITISAILEPNEKKLKELNKSIFPDIDSNSTKEDIFINNIMGKAKSSMENMNQDSDPTTAIMGLLSSGIVQDMVFGLQEGVENGEMDVKKLLGTMNSAIGNLIPQVPVENNQAPVENNQAPVENNQAPVVNNQMDSIAEVD